MDVDREDIKKGLRDNKLTKLDHKTVTKLRNEIQEKLDIVSKIYGIKLELGRIKFDDLSFKSSIKAQLESFVDSSAGRQISGEQVAFERNCWRYGLSKHHFNATVTFPRGKYRGLKGNVVALNTRAKKYPIVVRLQNGTGSIRVSPTGIKEMLRI